MKGKKPACTLLVTMLILGVAMVNVAADPQPPKPPKLFVDPPTYIAGQLGEVFTININIANITDLRVFEFKLGYNTTLLDALDTAVGPFPQPPVSLYKEIHDPEGYVWVSGMCESTSGDGTLVTITFNATYAESASCPLDLYDTKLYNSLGTRITHDVEDGNYQFATLDITVATDKPTYIFGENVEILGNLTLDDSPVQGLVALEVYNPHNRRLVVRTLQIGPTPPPGDISIVAVVPCDAWGTPKQNFTRNPILPDMFYVNVTVRNSGNETKNVLVTANAYDQNMVPMHGVPALGPIPLGPGVQTGFVQHIYFPEWAALGTGTVYASVFTDWPKNGGVPYCPENSSTFQIVDSTQAAALEKQDSDNSTAIRSLTENAGNYSLTFKFPPAFPGRPGIHRVYASASYERQFAVDSTAFGVNVISVPDDYPTIQGAINATSPTNNTIIVLPGTYNETLIINKTLTLVGVDPSNTIINGSGTGTVVTVTADNVEISRFTIQNSGSSPSSGIALKNSDSITISENIITSNKGYGINIHSSNNSFIADSILSNNNYGIYLNHSTSATLRNNIMICNKYNFGVFGDSILDFIHVIDTSNTVDGKPIIYWINQQNREVPSNAGFIAIVNSTKIAVRGLDITKNGQGVLLAFTNDSLIERVETINNEYGIYQVHSHSNTIVVNSVSNNTVGIYQGYSNENLICHNNFINNTNQVEIYQSSNNTWDDGAGKGNYWSDYNGTDLDFPPDGVGDEYLPWQGVDWYPLMNPYVLMHDIAITNVTFVLPCSESQLYPGWVIDVIVTVKNEGDFTENFFNVITYYDGNPIEMKFVTELFPQAEIDINFAWDTEGVSPGNYTISAEAIAVPGETETIDNTYTDGNVTLLVPTVHDVAVASVTPILPYNTSHVYTSWMTNVTVVVKNEGHYKETFNVTTYYNGNPIETKTITLYPLTNTTVTLTWNTTGVSRGNYTISANATIAVDDDPGDNTLTDGEINVRLMGDVNDDGNVDGGDQIMVGNALWSSPDFEPWRYNLYADVNGDGSIDGGDQISVGNHLWGLG